MKINTLVLVFGGAFALTACQSYPKNPASVSWIAERVPVNRTVPSELMPFIDAQALKRPAAAIQETAASPAVIPSTIYVLRSGETAQDVTAAIAADNAVKQAKVAVVAPSLPDTPVAVDVPKNAPVGALDAVKPVVETAKTQPVKQITAPILATPIDSGIAANTGAK